MHKILIVDDDEMNRDMLSRRLTRRGFDVLVSSNGVDALSLAESEQPDVILMDLSMPELDGYEATRRLKQRKTTTSIPVIALSAHAMIGDREKALNAGCDEYDIKPIDLQRLLKKVGTFLRL